MTDDSPIDAYLAKLPAEQRAALAQLRAEALRLVPDAEESMSYGMPVIKHRGQALLWFAAWKHHCSVYPLTDTFLAAHADELERYERTKGSLHFTPEDPLPPSLFAAMIRARLDDLDAGT